VPIEEKEEEEEEVGMIITDGKNIQYVTKSWFTSGDTCCYF
jgi:hypothetical protein